MLKNQDIVDVVIKIVEEAGQKALDIYDTYTSQDVFIKKDNSPVTTADIAVEKMISEALLKLFPDIPIVGEETVAEQSMRQVDPEHYAMKSAKNIFWLIDPIDGTREFVKKTGQFTINVALIEYGKPILGVILAPVFDKLYVGSHDFAPFCVKEGERRPLAVSHFDPQSLRVVTNGGHERPFSDHFPMLALKESLLCGSSLKFCMVASGEADFYPRLGPTCAWDTAAGQVILEAAGGCVLHYEAPHASLTYDHKDPAYKNPFFMACGTSYAHMLEIMNV